MIENYSNKNAKVVNVIIILLYSALILILALKHEPWADEAQAWLIARDSSILDILINRLRYEGTPGLWHLILYVPAKLGMSYYLINVVSALIGIIGVGIFLFRSPFPLVVKVLFPFSYFIAYQYSIVARSYVIFAPTLFFIAIFFKKRFERPGTYSFLLCILANISLHGTIIAGALFVLYFFEIINKVKNKDLNKTLHTYILSFVMTTACLFLVVLLVYPPDDINFAPENIYSLNRTISILLVVIGDSLLSNLANDSGGMYGINILLLVISIVILLTTVKYLHYKEKLKYYLIPFFMLVALFSIRHFSLWHLGIIFLLWIFALWISFESEETFKVDVDSRKMEQEVCFCLIVVFLVQINWTMNSFKYDFYNDYSSSRAIAEYIEKEKLGKKSIYGSDFYNVAILPYFDENIYNNLNNKNKPSYWVWSKNNTNFNLHSSLKKNEAEILVISERNNISYEKGTNRKITYSKDNYNLNDYVLVKHFKGATYWKTKIFEEENFAIYKKK